MWGVRVIREAAAAAAAVRLRGARLTHERRVVKPLWREELARRRHERRQSELCGQVWQVGEVGKGLAHRGICDPLALCTERPSACGPSGSTALRASEPGVLLCA